MRTLSKSLWKHTTQEDARDSSSASTLRHLRQGAGRGRAEVGVVSACDVHAGQCSASTLRHLRQAAGRGRAEVGLVSTCDVHAGQCSASTLRHLRQPAGRQAGRVGWSRSAHFVMFVNCVIFMQGGARAAQVGHPQENKAARVGVHWRKDRPCQYPYCRKQRHHPNRSTP